MILYVYPDTKSKYRLSTGARNWRCCIGRGGLTAADTKQEGDGATPLGSWALRQVFYRPDKIARPQTLLPVREITPDDGWCDDPGDTAYNQLVKLPYPGRHEKMWRQDELYDVVVILGYNDNPPIPGKGSAIFLHCAKQNYPPTEGCVALERAHLLEILKDLDDTSRIQIMQEAP